MFLFKQKTAYGIEYGLVGSEMCIRDRSSRWAKGPRSKPARRRPTTTTDLPAEVAIGLGGNVGSPERAFSIALAGLALHLEAVSYTHLTLPTSDLV